MPRRNLPPPLYLNFTSEDGMVATYGIARKTARAIVANRPYHYFSDVLRREAVLDTLSAEDLFAVLAHSRHTFPIEPRRPIMRTQSQSVRSDWLLGFRETHKGPKQVFIGDQNGNEIISAELAAGTTWR